MPSELYKNLSSRVGTLEERYLPKSPNPVGDYSDEEQDDAKACILLVHAEIEEYLENLAGKLCTIACEKLSRCEFDELTSAFLYSFGGRAKELEGASSLSSIAKGADALHRKAIGGNNGIKAKDVKKMFAPFSVGGLELEETLEASLDSFGTLRGKCAHAGSIGIKESINCYETRQKIDELMNGLSDFDERYIQAVALQS